MDIVEMLEELTIDLFYRAYDAPNLVTGQVLLGMAAAAQSLTLAVARETSKRRGAAREEGSAL